MEAPPQYPTGSDDEHDRSNSNDGIIHVECIRRMRGRQDEKDADEHGELLKFDVVWVRISATWSDAYIYMIDDLPGNWRS